MHHKSFKQYLEEKRELSYDPEAIKRANSRVVFPEITVSPQELEDAIAGDELRNGKSLMRRFTMAIANSDGGYILKSVPDSVMLKAEVAERGNYPLELGNKEWNVLEVTKLYQPAPFGSGKKFAGAVIKVEEA